jgi:histidine ammonia-lyase
MRLGKKNPSLRELRSIARDAPPLELDPAALAKVRTALSAVEAIVASG